MIRTETILVWVNPRLANARIGRYELIGRLFLHQVEARGVSLDEILSPPGFHGSQTAPTPVPYDIIVRIRQDIFRFIGAWLGVYISNMFREVPVVRLQFQVLQLADMTVWPIDLTAASSQLPSLIFSIISY